MFALTHATKLVLSRSPNYGIDDYLKASQYNPLCSNGIALATILVLVPGLEPRLDFDPALSYRDKNTAVQVTLHGLQLFLAYLCRK